MSLENEYFAIKSELESETEILKEYREIDRSKMDYIQLKTFEKGVSNIIKSMEETEKILEEIKIELYDHIYNDGEVSRKTIKSLLGDITNDILFKEQEDDYDLEVLQGKQEFLKSLL